MVGAVREAVEARTDFHVEFRFHHATGAWNYIEARGRAHYDDAGRALRVYGIAIDVTERKRTEELRALAGAIVASSADAIVSKTLTGVITSWNAGAERLFGYTADEMIGRSITTVIPAERADEERLILERLLEVRAWNTSRLSAWPGTGVESDVSITISPVRDEHGAIVGASKVARDITERKRADRALREKEGLLRAEKDALAKLNELSARLWRTKSLSEGLHEMLGALIDLVSADKGNIQLLDAASGTLTIEAQRGFSPDFLTFFHTVSADDDSRLRSRLTSWTAPHR